MEDKREPLSCWPPPDDHAENMETESGHNDDIHMTEQPRKKMKVKGPTEVLADISLAKWWRTEGRRLGLQDSLPNSSNPNTILFHLSGTNEAQKYMRKEIDRLERIIFKGSHNASTFAAIASFHVKLKEFEKAFQYMGKALALEPQNCEYKWYQIRINKQLEVQKKQKNTAYTLKHCYSGLSHLLQVPQPSKVPRRSASNFSFKDFLFDHALRKVPVIITDLGRSMTSKRWDLEHIKQSIGHLQVTPKRLVQNSVEWARLENCSQTTSVANFINNIDVQKPEEEKTYLFDWSIPLHCPELAKELIIPKFFAGDFLQRTTPGSLYKDSWPSLFIAPSGLKSELHVDAFGSNFWMALFQGRKRWVFFPKDDLSSLYPTYPTSMDPVFEVNLGEPDLKKHPLLAMTSPMECILEPGEILFVPAGCPHRVENLETSLAISANYVDLSNCQDVKEEMRTNALMDERAAHLLQQLESAQFPSKMDSNIQHLPWEEFKKWPKENYHLFNY